MTAKVSRTSKPLLPEQIPAHALPLLSLHAADVRFGEVYALREATLSLRQGERLALVGANGSGKTSLLRLLHGLLLCSEGQRRCHSLADGRAPRQAMLFQKPYLLSLSALNNLRLALWLGGVPARERDTLARQALARVGLQQQAQQRATTLSGGQQQRLALARAWALKPDILLLDEPTASLDPGAKREVENLLAEFAGEGLTVVLSSHNLGQVKRLATRVIYLEEGRLRVDLPVDVFFDASAPNAAAEFLEGEGAWK